MNRIVSQFLDRLAERFTAILAGVISSRVEGLQATAQAEQQSQLEDLARKYEADGKTKIAQTLRERALRLTSANLSSEAVDVMEAVTREPLNLTNSQPPQASGDLRNLPDFASTAKPRNRRRKAGDNTTGPDATGATP